MLMRTMFYPTYRHSLNIYFLFFHVFLIHSQSILQLLSEGILKRLLTYAKKFNETDLKYFMCDEPRNQKKIDETVIRMDEKRKTADK